MTPKISIYFDERRKKPGDKCPVKLRVYFRGLSHLYITGITICKDDFENSYLVQKPKNNTHRELRIKILAIESRANQIKDELKHFSIEKFERKFFLPRGATNNVFNFYIDTINQIQKEERYTTASNYDLSAKSLKAFLQSKNKRGDFLAFDEISVTFLKEYERWMLSKEKSITTIGIYLRPLRAIFNVAIRENEISPDIYPFGKSKYQIPAARNIKKALSNADLKKLLEVDLSDNELLKKARDFWFFSYVCSGMNMKDIAELKWNNVLAESITYIRSKTKHATRVNQKPIIVMLTPFAQAILREYGSERSLNAYVFPILSDSMGAKEKMSAVQAFTRFVNQHIKKVAEKVGITTEISTYWARHSYTTAAIRNGASMEFIQESLGHTSLQTTMIYWGGFENKAKKEIAEKLLNF